MTLCPSHQLMKVKCHFFKIKFEVGFHPMLISLTSICPKKNPDALGTMEIIQHTKHVFQLCYHSIVKLEFNFSLI